VKPEEKDEGETCSECNVLGPNDDCVVHRYRLPGRVSCDDNCGAVEDPKTLAQYRDALLHWRNHTYLGGCSHGN
jgi:hypothetical protein